MKHCRADVFPLCMGHMAKYDNCMTEALHTLVSETHGWADEEGGDQDDFPGGYMWLVLMPDGFTVKDGTWGCGDGFEFRIAPGTYVTLHGASSGAVTMVSYPTAEEAREAFDAHDRAFGIWDDQVNGRVDSYV